MKDHIYFRQVQKIKVLIGTAGLLSIALYGSMSYAATAPAGYVISNQAAAEYTVDGQVFKVTSNLVETIVEPRALVNLLTDETQLSTQGKINYFTHQVINNGNMNDSFNLATTVVSGGLTDVTIYADENNDGIPDNTTPITSTPVLQSGKTYNVVVAVKVPTTATVPSTASFKISATSAYDNTVTATNTDTLKLTNDAIIDITKSMTPSNAAPGDTVHVTFNLTNSGNINSGKVTLTDALPSQLNYVAGTGRWSVSGTTALTDNTTSADPSGINYDYNVTNSGKITAIIDSIPVGATQQVSFDATVKTTAPDNAAGTVTNKGTVSCDCDNNATTAEDATDSNPASIIVNAQPAVAISDTGSTTDTGGTANDDVVEPQGPFYQGAVILFDNVVTNNGNLDDIFNITTLTNTFPTGTSFTFTKSDGITPLTDTNNDGIVDTGLIAQGSTKHIFLRVQLPPDSSGTGPFTATVQAQSINDVTVKDTVTDKIAAISPAVVDLTHTISGTDNGANVADNGWGAGPETVPQLTKTTDPNSTTSFNLVLNHSQPVVGSYYFEYSTDSTFATLGGLPSGWSVAFYNTSGTQISSAIVNASSTTATQYSYTAKVTVPAGTPAGNYDLYFRARSLSTGAQDVIYDRITVNENHDVAILPSNIGQLQAGGIQIYTHQLQNLGNVTETSGPITLTTGTSGWASTAFLDTNNNGVFDPGTDVVFTDLSQISGGLAAGQTVNVFVRVQAPTQALPGDSNVTTINVAATGDSVTSNDTATDQTSVISGAIKLSKEQASDSNCDGTADTGFGTATITNIGPGECVIYRVTASNISAYDVSSLSIKDTIPEYSTLDGSISSSGTTAITGTVSSSLLSGSTVINGTWSKLEAGKTAIIQFRAKLS